MNWAVTTFNTLLSIAACHYKSKLTSFRVRFSHHMLCFTLKSVSHITFCDKDQIGVTEYEVT